MVLRTREVERLGAGGGGVSDWHGQLSISSDQPCRLSPTSTVGGRRYPGPIFKVRLLHVKKGVGPQQTGRRWEDLVDSFPKTNVSFGIGIVLGAE